MLTVDGRSNYVAVFKDDVYFLNTELKLIRMQLTKISNTGYKDSEIPIPEKIEDFLIEDMGTDKPKIIYLTEKGMIKEYTEGVVSNKSLDCTKYTQNVNYWNKLAKVGNCVLVAGCTETHPTWKKPYSNTVVMVDNEWTLGYLLLIPHTASTTLLTSDSWPVLRMLEIPSTKEKRVTFVLAAEYAFTVHMLAIANIKGNPTKKRRIEKTDSKQVSSSSSKPMLLEELLTQMPSAPCAVPPVTPSSTSDYKLTVWSGE